MAENSKPQAGIQATPASLDEPPTLGLAVVADLWLWGGLTILAPTYLAIRGWDLAFNVVGLGMLVISFSGALLELSKLWQSEGLKYWGVSLVFLFPALILSSRLDKEMYQDPWKLRRESPSSSSWLSGERCSSRDFRT